MREIVTPGAVIKVTAADIAQGEWGSMTRCPVAIAIQRMIPDEFRAYVTCDWIEIVKGNMTIQRLDVPDEAGEWILRFDEWKDFSECENDIERQEFFDEHNDGEPFAVESVEPFEFTMPKLTEG